MSDKKESRVWATFQMVKSFTQSYEEEKDFQPGKIHLPHWNRLCQEFQNIINKWLDIHNLKDLHLKHDHMSSAQFMKRTIHLDISGKVYDLYQHVVKTCPFCNSTKPRPDRPRVSGLRPEEFGDLIFLDHGSTKFGQQTFEFLIVVYGPTSQLTAYPCNITHLSIRSHLQTSRVGWILSRWFRRRFVQT